MYCCDEQSSNAVINAGRQSVERFLRMKVMAVGVKGLLSMRRESFVVCALSKEQASESSRRGFGGLTISGAGDVVDVNESWKVERRASVESMVTLRVDRSSEDLEAADDVDWAAMAVVKEDGLLKVSTQLVESDASLLLATGMPGAYRLGCISPSPTH